MSGGKESPRQKMVGLMYLVLMAMLALNVSKDVLNAFVTVDKNVLRTIKNFNSKNQFLYNEFSKAAAEPGKEVVNKKWNDKAILIKTKSDSLFEHITQMKLALLKIVEGVDFSEGKDSLTGLTNIKDLSEVQNKDNYDEPTHFLVGDPSHIKTDDMSAHDMKNRVHQFRDDLAQILATFDLDEKLKFSFTANPEVGVEEQDWSKVRPYDLDFIKTLYASMTYPETVKDHEVDVAWEVGMFDHSPIVAAMSVLSSVQANIRNSEAEALTYLHNTWILGSDFNFNKINAISLAKSSYINKGDKVDVKIFIAAFDSTATPKILFRKGRTGALKPVDKIENGEGIITLPSNQVGPHSLSGQIIVEKSTGGTKTFDWDFDYEVGAPTAVVSNTEMSVVYAGYENKIQAIGSGFPPDKIRATCSGCNSLRRNGGIYIADVGGRTRVITINVLATTDNGTTVRLGEKKFKVFPLPPAEVFYGGVTNGAISRSKLRNTPVLIAKLDNSPLQVTYKVVGFDVSTSISSRRLSARGNRVTPEMKRVFSRLRPGATVNILAKVKDPSGKVRRKAVSLTVR